MKDAKHHLKHVQKKVIQSVNKTNPQKVEKVKALSEFKRPKKIQNKRKIA